MKMRGAWHIYEMEVWDEYYLNMEVQAFIQIHEDCSGNFQFGLVTGQMDGKIVEGNNGTRYEFTWDGFDECDRNCGTGWMKMLEDDKVEGEFNIHLGDRSLFLAKRAQ